MVGPTSWSLNRQRKPKAKERSDPTWWSEADLHTSYCRVIELGYTFKIYVRNSDPLQKPI